ncbi:hypothetical protein [Streptomyces sp. CBMA29]|nr:hypothetical protein [Streptomyces sp. CBMA29]
MSTRRRSLLPDPVSKAGATFYAVAGSALFWLAVEVLPHHLVIGWH